VGEGFEVERSGGYALIYRTMDIYRLCVCVRMCLYVCMCVCLCVCMSLRACACVCLDHTEACSVSLSLIHNTYIHCMHTYNVHKQYTNAHVQCTGSHV